MEEVKKESKKSSKKTQSVVLPPQSEMVLGKAVNSGSQYSTHFNENFNVDGTPDGIDLEGIFNAPQEHIEEIVGYSKYCYRKYGLIMRTINIMRDFGANGVKLTYPQKNQKVKNVIEAYRKQINEKQFIRDSILELALTGNLACYDRGKRIDIYPIHKIDVVPLIENDKQLIAYKIDRVSFSLTSYGKEYDEKIKSAYPKEIIEARDAGKDLAILNSEYAYFAKINSSRYESYGISVILPAFEDLAHKSLLKEAERATANDVIDRMMMIKIGDADNKPNKALIDGYTELFDNVKGSIRFTVPYYVDAKYVEPTTTAFGNDKFIEVDTDILNTLGISLSLLRGSDGSNYADGILNFTGLRKTIDNIREPLVGILHGLYRKELERNGMNPDLAPTPSFEEVVIDKEAKIQLMMELFTNAGLPYQVLYEEAGFDFDHIKLIRENENDEDMDETFKLHSVPFSGNEMEGDGSGDEGGAPKKKLSDRKSDKSQSNNNQPRTGLKNTNRSVPTKKASK